MMRCLLPGLFLLLSLQDGDEKTVLLKNGDKLQGSVTMTDAECVVETASGKKEVAREQVAAVFATLKEATDRLEIRVEEAKKRYHEAEELALNDPDRNARIKLAIDILGEVRSTYTLLIRHFPSDDSLSKNLQRVMEFLRLARGAMGSEMTDASTGEKPTIVKTVTGSFGFTPPPKAERSWVWSEPLPPGQAGLLAALENEDAKTRLDAVRRLTSPPYPPALAAMLRRLETETNDEVLNALSEALKRYEPAALIKGLAWVKKEPDPKRRGIVLALLRPANDKAVGEFLIEWLCEAPPRTHPERAAFASCFRRMHAWSVDALQAALTKQKSAPVQIEIVKQLGAAGDKRAASILLKVMEVYKKEALVALSKLGAPTLPTVARGEKSENAEVRRLCTWLGCKLTGLAVVNADRHEDWFLQQKKRIDEEEKAWWADQAKNGYPASPDEFKEYDRNLEEILK